MWASSTTCRRQLGISRHRRELIGCSRGRAKTIASLTTGHTQEDVGSFPSVTLQGTEAKEATSFAHSTRFCRLIKIESVARIRIGSPFRCAVTDPQLLRLMESLSCSQNRTSAHRFGVPSISLHHTKDACLQGGTQGKSKNCYRPRINYNLLISIQSSSPVNQFHRSSDHSFCQDCRGRKATARTAIVRVSIKIF